MQDFATFTREQALRLGAVFTDIDGTLTDAQGRIPAAVFAAMEAAREAGLGVVPVTGRPAGWCDLIARTWPVDGVIGENGGLYFRCSEQHGQAMTRVYVHDEETRAQNRARLTALAAEVLSRHPGAGIASDQSYREFDLAVDFCEDVAALPAAEIDAIVALLEAAGCTVKVSNIHVNAWFGHFDKASMCIRYAADRWGWDIAATDGDKVAFFGDSPNDAPLFALFECAVGVAGVRRMADRIDPLPTYCTTGEGAAGFVAGIEHILALRAPA